jgi:WD40 repeat protein
LITAAVFILLSGSFRDGGEASLPDNSQPHMFSVSGDATCLAFSWDGKYLVAAANDFGSRGKFSGKAEIKVWEISSHKEIATLPLDQEVTSLSIHPKGTLLALSFASKELGLKILEFPGLKAKTSKAFEHPIRTARFSTDGNRIALSFDAKSAEGRTILLNAEDFSEVFAFPHKGSGSGTIAFSPGKKKFVIAHRLKMKGPGWDLDIIDYQTLKWESGFRLPDPPHSLAFSPDGSHLIAILSGGFFYYDFPSGREDRETGPRNPWTGSRSVGCFSPDGKYILEAGNRGGNVGNARGKVFLWSTERKELIPVWEEKRVLVPCGAFSPDSRHFAVGTSPLQDGKGRVVLFKTPEK